MFTNNETNIEDSSSNLSDVFLSFTVIYDECRAESFSPIFHSNLWKEAELSAGSSPAAGVRCNIAVFLHWLLELSFAWKEMVSICLELTFFLLVWCIVGICVSVNLFMLPLLNKSLRDLGATCHHLLRLKGTFW